MSVVQRNPFSEAKTVGGVIKSVVEELEYQNLIDGQNKSKFGNGYGTEFNLRKKGETIVRVIEIPPEGPDRSTVNSYLKRHGKKSNKELFAIILYSKNSDEQPLQRRITPEATFMRIKRRKATETVDIKNDLKYFIVNFDDIAPMYIDYFDNLTVGNQSYQTLAEKTDQVFSLKEVTKNFYRDFKKIFQEELQDSIHDLKNENDNLTAYTQLVVNRILFLMFVQEKGWLDDDKKYVQKKYKEAKERDIDVYEEFFKPLFFEALNTEGIPDNDFLGKIPYLNGGLFEEKEIEKNVTIDQEFFDILLNSEKDEYGNPKGFLLRYKLSLSESNPAEQELVVDPEFIGRIFEMFMQKEEKSKKGTFYTPKEITQYMGKNAIKYYLLEDYPNKEEEISQFVSEYKIPESIGEKDLEHIRDKIKNIDVIDPAVGSGAFVISMLEELTELTDVLNNELGYHEDRFNLKEDFIARSLYGVDIDPRGIELCKFRTWLHLMQDLNNVDLDEFLKNNDKYALPNLEVKFFVGNSLVGDFKPTKIQNVLDNIRKGENKLGGEGIQTKLGGRELNEIVEDIEKKRREYLDAHGKEKEQIEQELGNLINEIDELIDWNSSDFWMEDVVEAAGSSFKWSVNIPEVILKGGFDIVIGNPPYEGQVRADYKKELRKFYAERKDFKYYAKTDLFQYFVHRGTELAKEDGIFTYIMSDTFFANINKSDIRTALLDEIIELTQVNPDAFDASVETAIFLLKKESKNRNIRFNQSYEASIESYVQLIQPVKYQDEYSIVINNQSYTTSYAELYEHDIYSANKKLYENSINNSFYEPTENNLSLFSKFIAPYIDIYDDWDNIITGDSSISENIEEIRAIINEAQPGDALPFGILTKGGVGFQLPKNSEYIHVLEGTKKAEQIAEKGYYSRSKLDKTINPDKTIPAEDLSDKEKLQGIEDRGEQTWVKITRESKNGRDIYYCPTDEYIDWSKSNVKHIKEDGYPRNDQYYLRSGIATKRGGGVRNMEWRLIEPSVFTDTNQVFIPINDEKTPIKYLLGIMNSELAEYIANTFLNRIGLSTQDVRHIPIKIPEEQEKNEVIALVDEAIDLQKEREDVLDEPDMERIDEIKSKLDDTIEEIYEVSIQ